MSKRTCHVVDLHECRGLVLMAFPDTVSNCRLEDGYVFLNYYLVGPTTCHFASFSRAVKGTVSFKVLLTPNIRFTRSRSRTRVPDVAIQYNTSALGNSRKTKHGPSKMANRRLNSLIRLRRMAS